MFCFDSCMHVCGSVYKCLFKIKWHFPETFANFHFSLKNYMHVSCLSILARATSYFPKSLVSSKLALDSSSKPVCWQKSRSSQIRARRTRPAFRRKSEEMLTFLYALFIAPPLNIPNKNSE